MTETADDFALPVTRASALRRLDDFLPASARAYAATRNEDRGAGAHQNVSRLSFALRHRLIGEAEVTRTVLSRHDAETAEKFLQEVAWRTYWKGWLQMRPAIWDDYLEGLPRDQERVEADPSQASVLRDVERSATGIDCLDAWSRELRETGYLHNHARMWFASIWVFNLGLPWRAGADFFLRHLLDGDPASNTLSWRWVAGLHTAGKAYLARPDNIRRYTGGRFQANLPPRVAEPPEAGPALPPPRPPRPLPGIGEHLARGAGKAGVTGVLITSEDLLGGVPLTRLLPAGVNGPVILAAYGTAGALDKMPALNARALRAAIADLAKRLEAEGREVLQVEEAGSGDIAEIAVTGEVSSLVALDQPVGRTASLLSSLGTTLEGQGCTLITARRGWDDRLWHRATHGFFRFKKHLPPVCDRLSNADASEEIV